MITVTKFNELLENLNACEQAREWANGKTWQEVFDTCHRGDWLLWLFARTNPNDLQLLTLAKGHCTNTVRHLMKDKRSIKAVDTAIAYGEGNATIKELNAAAAAAYAAAAAAAADADADANAYAAAAAAASGERIKNQKLTADICRKFLPIEVWNIKN